MNLYLQRKVSSLQCKVSSLQCKVSSLQCKVSSQSGESPVPDLAERVRGGGGGGDGGVTAQGTTKAVANYVYSLLEIILNNGEQSFFLNSIY